MTRLLFRSTKGQALALFRDFDSEKNKKAVYLVVYQEGSLIGERVRKICDSFLGQRFEVPPLSKIKKEFEIETLKIESSEALLETTEKQLLKYLMCVNRGPKLEGDVKGKYPSCLALYAYYMAKEKAIMTALNMLKQRDDRDITMTGFIWIPVEKEDTIK